MLGLLACGTSDPPPEAPPSAPSPPPSAPTPGPQAPSTAPPVIGGGEGSVGVRLQYYGVSPLYRGYFGTEAWVAALGDDLGGCLDDATDVLVSYDSERRIGRILVVTAPEDLACAPRIEGDQLDLTPLVPLGQALAGYRDTIAAERDIRVASFRVGVRLLKGTELCEIYTGGQFPPDGTTFSPCVNLAGHEHCVADRHEPITRLELTGEVGSALRRCLR